MTYDYLAIILSVFSLGVSLYTLWAVRVSPFKLVVYPPAVSLLNRAESSLVLDLTFFNQGRTPAAILDMEITFCDSQGRAISSPLKPKAFHQTALPQGDLPHILHFKSFTVKKDETVQKTIYFGLSANDPLHQFRPDVTGIDSIRLAFNVNNRWNKKCFTFNYSDLGGDPQHQDESSLFKLPFTPRFFPDVKPLLLRGSIFDPVF